MTWFWKKTPQQDTGVVQEPVDAGEQDADTGRHDADRGQQASTGLQGSTGAIVANGDVIDSVAYSVHAEGIASVAAGGSIHGSVTIRTTVLPASAVRDAADTEARGVVSLRARKHTFTGRTAELAEVRAELARGTGTPAVVVHGLGGVGKTELALQYAHLHSESYDLVWWIDSAAPGATEAALAAIAERLSPHWTGTEPSLSARAAWARAWLQQHDRWLLVHNNVEEPALLGDLLGSLPRGHHLITSRYATGWQRQVRFVGLSVLPRTDSVALIGSWVPFASPKEEWHAGQLAGELGDLPLALEQAGAYMDQTMTSIEAYRSSLHEFLDEAALDHARDEQTVAGVWALTLTALAESNPLSIELLHTLAWLDPDGLPRELLADLTAGPVQMRTALGLLRAYSMVTLSLEEVTVHRLVQKVLRDRATREATTRATADGPPPAPRGREAAERILLAAVYPNGPEKKPDTVQLARLAAHATALSTTDPGTYHPGPAQLFTDTALHLHERGQTVRALPLFEAYARQAADGFGADHPFTLNARGSVVTSLMAAGRLEAAADLLEELVERATRVLGRGDLITLHIRASLAEVHLARGQLQRAEDGFAAAVADSTAHLGPDHPRTLTLRNRLATTYENGHQFDRAIEIYEDLLRHEHGGLVQWKQEYSAPLQLNAATVRNNLAGAYEGAGRSAEAIATYRKALADTVRQVGADHPKALECLSNLGYALDAAEQREEASRIYRKVAEKRVRILGEDHPDTLRSQSNLAYMLFKTGEQEAGLELCRRTLVQREQILGVLHADTLANRNLLASAYDLTGDLTTAAELFETTLQQRREVLGSRHPDTLSTLSGYATCLMRAGNAPGAVALLEEALATQEELSEPEGIAAMTYRHNLATALRDTGAFDRSEELFTTVLEQRTRRLGADHPDTLISSGSLARLYQLTGDLDRAVPLYESALTGLTATFGTDHWTTRALADYLAEARTA
ncbi:FxSxx-COOH system tetratricopeptide repeat protein [Streptomyces sp. NPDC001621]|uniref:FxSxx-COOH system tetratricopeptide repeat protein n=1 Tax=Streptomyces sp. NPDC001621 TaxID=3364594 RepID=UPI0036BB9667